MPDKKILLLDFDGVIADTFHIGHSVAQKVCVYLTETEYRKNFEGNIIERTQMLREADHGDRCDHALDWLGAYMPEFNLHAKPFPNMPELLQTFSRTYLVLIVSSTHNDLIERFLIKYGLRDTVAGLYGLEVNARKDEKFKAIFSKYGITSSETVFVTDTLGDINEASSVGLTSIGVTWGFQDRATLERGKPFVIVDSPQELPATIGRYFALAGAQRMEG